MSLIDDAAECNVLGTERDLARLRTMWLEEFRERAANRLAHESARLSACGAYISAGVASDAAIRALPLGRGAREA